MASEQAIEVTPPVVFYRVVELHEVLALPPLSEMPDPWTIKAGDWTVSVTRKGEMTATHARYLWALACNPAGGSFIGDPEMEDNLIEALDAEIAKVRP